MNEMEENRVSHLPQDLVSIILLHVPAKALHNVTRHVCREWNLLIRSRTFIYGHLRNNSIGGLLFEAVHPLRNVVYAEMIGEHIEISSFSNCIRYLTSTCNGLALSGVQQGYINSVPSVINPLTRQSGTLPPHDLSTYKGRTWGYFALAFAEASMQYKVVCPHGKVKYAQSTTGISVLTIGVDSVWRDICLDQFSSVERTRALEQPPCAAGGYIHWQGDNYVLTMNVETEELRRFALPRLLRGKCLFLLPMGEKLSAVDGIEELLRRVWKMDSETGEWTLLHSIDLKPLLCIICDNFSKLIWCRPFGWLVAGEVLVFETVVDLCDLITVCIAYNVKTKGYQTFKLDGTGPYRVYPHVNSST